MSEMDQNKRSSIPGMSNALFPVSPERTNQKRSQRSRESSISDQINKFNSMATITRNAERGVNDAALKRAMLAREEAQTEARKYRNENESLRSVEDDMRKYREEAAQYKKEVKIISERYENLVEQFMAEKENHTRDKAKLDEYREKYARTRETHETTQKTWEKELRAARKSQKESFKVQSRLVQIQDELRSTKNTVTLMKVSIEEEKQRTKTREEEAFTARCELVNVQEELTSTKDKVKLVEQERDALRMIAKNEEILRIAAEGQLPLPSSPRKPSYSDPLSPGRFVSSASTEGELEELKSKVQYERQRVEQAFNLIDYMKAECRFKSCSCRLPGSTGEHVYGEGLAVSSPEAQPNPYDDDSTNSKLPSEKEEECQESTVEDAQDPKEETTTVFIPAEGIFRTLPSPVRKSIQVPQKRPIEEVNISRPASSSDHMPHHSRTPSFEPPARAIKVQLNTLLSLTNESQSPLGTQQSYEHAIEDEEEDETGEQTISEETRELESPSPHKQWQTISTTTRIPLKPDENTHVANKALFSRGHYPVSDMKFGFTPSNAGDENGSPTLKLRGGDPSSAADYDSNAIVGTMTKEEALAQIKLRRGRAQSIAQGTLTPRKKMCEGVGSYERRDISAPAAVAMRGGLGNGARTPKSAPFNKTKFGM